MELNPGTLRPQRLFFVKFLFLDAARFAIGHPGRGGQFFVPVAFFNAWGILVVFPLYTLHTLVLAFLFFRRKQISLPVLFLAGMLFGLYEAYITKVLWNPTWGDAHIMVAGLAVVQTAVSGPLLAPFHGLYPPRIPGRKPVYQFQRDLSRISRQNSKKFYAPTGKARQPGRFCYVLRHLPGQRMRLLPG